MKAAILAIAVAASLPAPPASAARGQEPQQFVALDLQACPRPAYPADALANNVSGTTTVELKVGDDGRAVDVRVATSSGRQELDEAALAGVRRCAFHAVLATGQAPTGWLKAQYKWIASLEKSSPAPDQAAFASMRSRAAAGDPDAQNRLGAWYQKGTGVAADPVQAAAWYRRAADSGHAVAQNNLGVLYVRGLGVPRDPVQAVYWYAKAAAQGHGWAQANLAWAYEHGSAGERDLEKSLYWLTRSADGGLAAAQVRLGMQRMALAQTDEDRGAAVAWFARAAAQDDPAGHYRLGRSFELGVGNAQDDVEAAAHYRAALGRSEGRAEVALGMLLEAGRGGALNEDAAAALYQNAMRWRYPPAFYHYGRLLEGRGDSDMALAVFRQGAELGDCNAVIKYVEIRQAQPVAVEPGTREAQFLARAATCRAIGPQAPAL